MEDSPLYPRQSERSVVDRFLISLCVLCALCGKSFFVFPRLVAAVDVGFVSVPDGASVWEMDTTNPATTPAVVAITLVAVWAADSAKWPAALASALNLVIALFAAAGAVLAFLIADLVARATVAAVLAAGASLAVVGRVGFFFRLRFLEGFLGMGKTAGGARRLNAGVNGFRCCLLRF
ncbi:MAG TPA: hypothetical protein VHY37_12470 [Tepidisphaeraceae bacterium]|nr:hypothetical protein [Tepidisphaeraceae bacterium]